MSKDEKPLGYVQVRCRKCGGEPKRHSVLHINSQRYWDDYGYSYSKHSDLIKCGGCETVKLWCYMFDEADYQCDPNPSPGPRMGVLYPEEAGTQNKRQESITGVLANADKLIPPDVHKMYVESVRAFEAHVLTLASVGIRATIEAICKHLGVAGKNLDKKIEALVTNQYLAPTQADLLHEGRFLGNEAAHELTTPDVQEVEDGLQIIESMLNLIYVVPEKAKRMKTKRLKRAAEKAPSTAVAKTKQK